MDKKVQDILESIKNPNSQATLKSEGRIKEIKADESALTFTYERDGISPEQKRAIEDTIINELKSFYNEEKITVKTVSKNPALQNGAPQSASASKAQIKTGHGPVGANKKRVPGVKNVLAISSGKGGVGKSTVTVNLAYALRNLGKKVAILDADVYGPSVPMLLGKRDAKPAATEDKKIIPIEKDGVSFISFGLFIGEDDAVIWRGPMLGGVLNQFLFDVNWGELDYLLIDLPPGTGDMQLSMVQSTEVDGALVVSTPQDVALLDARKGLNMFKKVNVPIIGMVENMSYFVPDDAQDKKYFIFGEGGVEKAATALETRFLGQVPMEIALRESCDKGEPYMANKNYEGRAVWGAYMSLAKNLEDGDNGKKGFFKNIFKRS